MIGTLTYTGARVGAVEGLPVKDLRDYGEHRALRFHEKGGVEREIPVRIDLDRWLTEYMESCGLDAGDAAGPLFRAAQHKGHGGMRGLTTRALAAHAIRGLVKRRLKDAGRPAILSPHSFRVLVVSDLLEQGVLLEDVQYLAGHTRPATTQIYDRRGREVSRNLVVDVNLKRASGREYLQIAVEPHPNPISYKGEFHYRSGSTKQVFRGAALSRFLLARYGRTWDDMPLPGVGLKDLDGRVVDAFRRRAAGSGRLPAEVIGEPIESLVENLSLRDGEHLKRAAALLFHLSPGRLVPDAYVKIGYFRGSELLFQDEIEGDLFAQVDRAMDLLYTKYTRGLVSYDGVYRVETFPVPREAMREAVINAVIHRDYASPTTIQIRVRDDRIAIWNAAHLKPEWTAELLAEEMSSRPHNPRIADAAVRGNAAGNTPPDTTQKNSATTQKTTQKSAGTTRKSARDRIVDCLTAEPTLTRTTLAERVGLSLDGVKYHLQNLKAAGVLRRVGSDRAGHWEVLG